MGIYHVATSELLLKIYVPLHAQEWTHLVGHVYDQLPGSYISDKSMRGFDPQPGAKYYTEKSYEDVAGERMYSDVTRAKWLQLISLASHALPHGDGEGLARETM